MKEFDRLIIIMDRLLGPGGCPWDKKQNHVKLLKYLKEESREFEVAVKKKDYENMKEELGDILLQVVFHCALAEKNKKFNIKEVIKNLNEKLIRRHPHVFVKKRNISEKEVLKQWEEIKKTEKKCASKKN